MLQGTWYLLLLFFSFLGFSLRPKPSPVPYIPPAPWVSAINQIGLSALQSELKSQGLRNITLAPFEALQLLLENEAGDNPNRLKIVQAIQDSILTAREHDVALKTKTARGFRFFHLKGEWAEKLKFIKRKRIPFYTPQGIQRIPMMKGTVYEAYLHEDHFRAVRLLYGDGKIAFYLFLPDKKEGLEAFLKRAEEPVLQRWYGQFLERPGEIQMPRLKLDYQSEMQRVGMPLGLVVNEKSDLQTLFEVDEKQSDLADDIQHDVIEVVGPEKFKMTVDRPFFFVVRDNETGLFLLLGTVTDPS